MQNPEYADYSLLKPRKMLLCISLDLIKLGTAPIS